VSRAERIRCTFGVLLAALAAPGVASAHAGKSALVATNFQAQITSLRPPTQTIDAKVVDGDRGLWLRAAPAATVLIPGAEGEPLLRFDQHGVFVNLRSLTAESDRIDRLDLQPDPNPHAPPRWHRLTSGHAYLWHEHRLHALEPLAHGHQLSVLGNWSLPLLIDGQQHTLHGRLIYRPPAPVWPWLALAALLAATPSAAQAASPAAGRRATTATTFAAVIVIWAVRIGRELYGRPDISWGAWLDIAFTSLAGIAFLAGLLHRDQRVRLFTAFLLGFGCLYQAWTTWPVLTHAVALTALPTKAAQAAVTAIIGLGAALLVIGAREQRSTREEPPRDSSRKKGGRSSPAPSRANHRPSGD
jgi:hypothetical protein